MMQLMFIELPPFERFRQSHLTDESFRTLQSELLANPEKGDIIQGTGGLRKIRVADKQHNQGKRGSFRVIYYLQDQYARCWLVAAYAKNQQADLTSAERKHLAALTARIKQLSENPYVSTL